MGEASGRFRKGGRGLHWVVIGEQGSSRVRVSCKPYQQGPWARNGAFGGFAGDGETS